jgi:hypothetical protein
MVKALARFVFRLDATDEFVDVPAVIAVSLPAR